MIQGDTVVLPHMHFFAAIVCCNPIFFVWQPIIFYKLRTGWLIVPKDLHHASTASLSSFTHLTCTTTIVLYQSVNQVVFCTSPLYHMFNATILFKLLSLSFSLLQLTRMISFTASPSHHLLSRDFCRYIAARLTGAKAESRQP